MPSKMHSAILILGLATGMTCSWPAAAAGIAGNGVASASGQAAPSAPMSELMASADRLRDSIRSLASKAPGPERDIAIAKAREALMNTQVAMINLPREYRPAPAASQRQATASDVSTLMKAADDLRASIHAMAVEPAGPRRVAAIEDANRALVATQVAMANAYDLHAFPSHTKTMGINAQSHCVRLSDMTACQ